MHTVNSVCVIWRASSAPDLCDLWPSHSVWADDGSCSLSDSQLHSNVSESKNKTWQTIKTKRERDPCWSVTEEFTSLLGRLVIWLNVLQRTEGSKNMKPYQALFSIQLSLCERFDGRQLSQTSVSKPPSKTSVRYSAPFTSASWDVVRKGHQRVCILPASLGSHFHVKWVHTHLLL